MIKDPVQNKQFKDWGYYSMDFSDFAGQSFSETKTKVFSLNNNICYQFNWYTLTTFEDPGGMLAWLEAELKALEEVGGAAILLSHVPNLDECNRQYGRRYHAIMDRFQHVIRWGIYAHVHKE